eukprot:m.46096 g.46096  ORF g.46096 m.46096 type:complete len:111 (+) comp8714_c0_seq1:220-552(+)
MPPATRCVAPTLRDIDAAMLTSTDGIHVVIPDGSDVMPAGAFCYCKKLISVVFPDEVTLIQHSAFVCSNLTSVTLPPKLETIGGNAFFCCQACLRSTSRGKPDVNWGLCI